MVVVEAPGGFISPQLCPCFTSLLVSRDSSIITTAFLGKCNSIFTQSKPGHRLSLTANWMNMCNTKKLSNRARVAVSVAGKTEQRELQHERNPLSVDIRAECTSAGDTNTSPLCAQSTMVISLGLVW